MGDAGQLSRFLVVLLLPFFIFLESSVAEDNASSSRYILQKRIEEDEGRSVTEVYLDQEKQRLIVKEYDRALNSQSGPASRSSDHANRISEAWRPSPQGWSMRKVSDFDLKDRTSQEAAEQAIEKLQEGAGSAVLDSSLDRLRTGSGRYELVQIGANENTQVGLYHNEKTGEFIFQSLNNNGRRKHEFFRTAGLATDIKELQNDQTPLDFIVMPARTFSQVGEASLKIEELMKSYGLQMPKDTLRPYLERARAFHEGMERLQINETTSGVFEEALYHPATNELLFRRYTYGNDGRQNVLEERFYDLNDDIGLEAALLRFQGLGEEAEEQLHQIVLAQGGCRQNLRTTMPLGEEGERNFEDINRVLEDLWRSELQGTLSSELKIEDQNTFTLDLDLLGRKHTLVGEVDAQGRLKDVNFRSPQLARDKKIRIRHILGDNGEKQFMVEAYNAISEEWEAQLVLEGEQGFSADGKQVPRIAAFLKGRQGEGEFQFDGFEKSIYELVLNEGQLVSSKPRLRYDGSRADHYDQVSTDRRGSGGLVNFAFHLFFSKKGRRKKVRENIIEEARKSLASEDFSGLISDQDIVRVADEVTEATGIRTDNFDQSKNRIEAVATEESFSRFGSLILQRMVGTLIEGESPDNIKDMVDVVMRDLRLCLRKSSQARNSDMANHCMAIFMREAPVDVAKEILKLKMIEAGLGDFAEVGERDFLACTQENYDPIKKRVESDVGMSVVQGCLYKALMETVDKVASPLVDQKVAEISRDMNLNLNYPASRLNLAKEKTRSCLNKEGLGRYGPRGLEVDLNKLGNTGADLFEQGFMTCMNLLVEDVALSVGEVAMAARVSELDLTDNAKNAIIQQTYEPGMRGCMERQKEVIADLRDRYQKERAEKVARQGNDKNLNMSVKVPAFDPLECNRVLTNLATGEALEQTLKEMFGVEKYQQIIEKEGVDPKACFQKLHEDNLRSIGLWLNENIGLGPEERKAKGEARDAAIDRASANCLKEGMGLASYYVAQETIKEKLSENPEYADIELAPDVQDLIGKSVKSCFMENLKSVETTDAVLQSQEALKDVCAVALLQDPAVQGPLFSPFVEKGLTQVEMDSETREKVVSSIIAALSEDLKGAKTLDEAMAMVDGVKAKAVPLVLRGVLTQKIADMTEAEEGNKQDQDNVLSLVQNVEDVIFGSDGNGPLGRELIKAIELGDEAQVKAAISAIEISSAQTLGPTILQAKGDQLLADGALDSKEDVDLLVSKGTEFLNACLLRVKSENMSDPLDHCVNETTVLTTELILKHKLGDTLENHPLLKTTINEEEREKLIAKLVDENLTTELGRISSLEEGPEKDRQMSDFIFSFKMAATRTVFDEAIDDILKEKLPTPRYFDERAAYYLGRKRDGIADRAKMTVNQCMANYEEQVDKSSLEKPHGLTEVDMDQCLNKARLNLTKEILPKRLEFILHYLHGDKKRVRGLTNKAMEDFNTCAVRQSISQSSKPYGNHLDGCLTSAINTFVGAVIVDMREGEPALLSGGEKIADWQQCRESLKKSAYNHVHGSGPMTPEMAAMDEADFFAAMYRDGEAKEPNRAPNLDWLIPNIIECAVQKIVPNLTIEFRNEFLERHKDELAEESKGLIISLTEAAHKVFSSERENGEPILVDISNLFGKANPETVSNEPAEDGTPPVRPTPIIELLKEFEPIVVEHINNAAAYDPQGMAKAIKDFEEQTLAKLQATEGEEIPLDIVVDSLLDSDMADIAIESMISSIVREETMKALEAEGADTAVVWLLSSKEMIKRLFGQGKGKEALEKLKKEYLRPLLLGKRSEFALPNELMSEIKNVLIEDTQKGGFVETLFGPIIQNNLDKKRDWIESGWSAIVKVPVAGFKGLNRHRDFTWGSRFSPMPTHYQLRNTPSGQKAVNFFAENLLKPMLNGGISDKKKEEATEELGGIIEEAMGENNPPRQSRAQRRKRN